MDAPPYTNTTPKIDTPPREPIPPRYGTETISPAGDTDLLRRCPPLSAYINLSPGFAPAARTCPPHPRAATGRRLGRARTSTR